MIKFVFGGTSAGVPNTKSSRVSRLNTSCGLVVHQSNPMFGDKVGLVIDNGSGIINVVNNFEIMHVNRVVVLQTHYHLDHMNGLPYNKYLFDRKMAGKGQIKMYGPILDTSCEQAVHGMFLQHMWPIGPIGSVHGLQIESFNMGETLRKEKIGIEGIDMIETIPLYHPGGCVGYKIHVHDREKNVSVVIATDCELDTGARLDALSEFAYGCDLLVVDCQWNDDNYIPGHGHNSATMVGKLVRKIGSGTNVYLTHFAPHYSQDGINLIRGKVVEIGGSKNIRSASDYEIVTL